MVAWWCAGSGGAGRSGSARQQQRGPRARGRVGVASTSTRPSWARATASASARPRPVGTDRKASTLSEPTAHSAARCYHDTSYCTRCDLLVGLGDLHVTAVEYDHDVGLLTVGVESTRAPMGCTTCGVIAHSHGRSDVTLVDAPCFDRPVRLVWRKRTWRCEETACATRVFTEQDEQVAVKSPAASVADHAGMLVGDQPDASRARLDQRDCTPARHDVEHRVDLDPPAVAGDG